jgi:hypothetical protein
MDPTIAQIEQAFPLNAPAPVRSDIAQGVLKNIIKGSWGQRIVCPEQFGAHIIPLESLPTFNPTTTDVDDTAALVACADAWKNYGANIYTGGRPYGLRSQITLDCTRESPRDGQIMFGSGRYGSGIQMTVNGFDALRLRGLVASGGANNWHGSVRNMFIKGGSGTGKAIVNAAGTRVSNARFEDLKLYSGSLGLHLDDSFQTIFEQLHISSHSSDGMVLEGGNATTIRNCYFSTFGAGCAGLRVWRMAGIEGTTGVDSGPIWAIFGGFPRWPTGSGTETARAGSTASRLRVATANPFGVGFLIGLDCVIQTGESRRVTAHSENGTDGVYITPKTNFSTTPTTYYFKDPWCAVATGRRPTIHMYGHTNLEIPTHCALKMVHEATVLIDNGLFYTYEGNDFDTGIWCRTNRVASGYGVELRGFTFYNEEGMEATRRLPKWLACEGSTANYRISLCKGLDGQFHNAVAGTNHDYTEL